MNTDDNQLNETHTILLWGAFDDTFRHFESKLDKAVEKQMNALDFGVMHHYRHCGLSVDIVDEATPERIAKVKDILRGVAKRWHGKDGARFGYNLS